MDGSVYLVDGFLGAPLLLLVQDAFAPLPLPCRFYGRSTGDIPPVAFTRRSWDSGRLANFCGIGAFAGDGLCALPFRLVRCRLAGPVASTPWAGWHWCPLAGAAGQVPPHWKTPLCVLCGFIPRVWVLQPLVRLSSQPLACGLFICSTMPQWFSV